MFVVPGLFSAFLCSTLLIVSMTFDRFYSIIRPHKAASFNTVKRAKITIVAMYIFSFLYNVPQPFLVIGETYQCVPYGKATVIPYGMIYYWLSLVVNYALPFILLLSMNSVIIHKIRTRNVGENNLSEGHTRGQGHRTKKKSSEGQIFAVLLLVTFSMLVLNTPAYMFFIYVQVANVDSSPKVFGDYHLFYHTAYKLQVTNYGINFFLYVMSGTKFRTDLVTLFVNTEKQIDDSVWNRTESTTF